ncbi:MAG TPA: VWA domain-containing protein [Gammaproteobacteria bacterium]
MEEQVGAYWHRLITQLASKRHPRAVVRLADVERAVAVMFRALGGDGGLCIEAVTASDYAARQGWLQRIAGGGRRVELAWRDERALRLPWQIDYFPEPQLNRDLYLWLAALAAHQQVTTDEAWLVKNQRLSRALLENYPGMQLRYRRLVEAHLLQRTAPTKLPEDEAQQEQAIRRALLQPGSVTHLPLAARLPDPVPLWLHPAPPLLDGAPTGTRRDDENGERASGSPSNLNKRRSAERVDKPVGQDKGLIALRMENIFSWAEFVNLDRSTDESEDLESAAEAADDMEQLSISQDAKAAAGTLRFDLDLPAGASDDKVTGEGILLPEWNYKTQRLQADHCKVVPMLAVSAATQPLPTHLRKTAKRLRAQFQQLAPARTWQRAQPEGSEIDMEAYLRFVADRRAGQISASDGLYREMQRGARDLSCLLLADLSLSTDAWIDNQVRVIDVIRDSLMLFAESLSATGDRFAMYGFSSRKRDPIRYHQLKSFDERYAAKIRGRIAAIRPGYYTRMGAAIRHSTTLLGREAASRRLLLILTDGKPNDLDNYEGRYGIEDTRHAIMQARQQGLQPFCVTIDDKGNDYLPYLFGSSGYVVIHRPAQLPRELPGLYARLTG